MIHVTAIHIVGLVSIERLRTILQRVEEQAPERFDAIQVHTFTYSETAPDIRVDVTIRKTDPGDRGDR